MIVQALLVHVFDIKFAFNLCFAQVLTVKQSLKKVGNNYILMRPVKFNSCSGIIKFTCIGVVVTIARFHKSFLVKDAVMNSYLE